MDNIEELKRVLPGIETFTTLKKIGNERHGACPFCGGEDRFWINAKDPYRWACRQCKKSGDIIDLHKKTHNLTTDDLFKKYLPNSTQARKSQVPSLPGLSLKEWNEKPALKELAFQLLCDLRKIDKTIVSQLIDDGQIKTGKHKSKQYVAFPFFDLAGENINAVQLITVDGKPFFEDVKKLFRKGDKPGDDCFFAIGADIRDTRADLIISESAINAITAYECCPDACSIALGGSTYTKKLESLKPHTNGRKVIVCQDNDPAGEKMVPAVRSALGSNVYAISFEPEDKPGTDINDLLQAGQKERVTKLIDNASPVSAACLSKDAAEAEQEEAWAYAKEAYPRTGFPWHSLPGDIADSFQQLARSCATSPLSIPGAALSILSSTIGSTISVSPKKSWEEPLIFWFGDVRPSGSGKTPAARALCEPIRRAQQIADIEQQEAEAAELLKKKKDRETVPRARGYFITDLTLEGIREDISGHGGTVCILDELSFFLNSQNQYKNGGTDREAWLTLHDGNDARIVRASKAKTISGARVNLFGGIQPGVFQQCFTDKNGVYLVDGTIFRFLLTYEDDQFFELTEESWSPENQLVWNRTLERSMAWADDHLKHNDLEPKVLILDEKAQDIFFDWANSRKRNKKKLPAQLQGFLSKMVGYSLRLAGILSCLDSFATTNKIPSRIVNAELIQKAIILAEFYMGHAVTASYALANKTDQVLSEPTEQEKILAGVLEKLRPEVDNGKLAIGFILEHFNKSAPKENQFKSAKAMGAFIRNLGLTIPAGTFRNKGKSTSKCLLWDKKTETFLKQSHQCHQGHQAQQTCIFVNDDIEKPMSSMSSKKCKIENPDDIDDIEKTKSSLASLSPARDDDIDDFDDIISKEKNKNDLPDNVKIEGDAVLI